MIKQKFKNRIQSKHLFVFLSQAHSFSVFFFLFYSDIPKSTKQSAYEDAATDGPILFEDAEERRGLDQKPFTFPTDSSIMPYSRRVRWPHERHSPNAIDPSTSLNPIVFPRSQTGANEMLTEITYPSTESAEQNAIKFISNATNSSVFSVNETAIRNELIPLIYIDDNGIFQVKYIHKGENGSSSINDPYRQRNFTSINATKEMAIISNDNQQIHLDQHIHTDTSVVKSATSPITTPPRTAAIDLSRDHTINNNKLKHEPHRESTSPKTVLQQQRNQLSNDKQPTPFDELPVFV